MRRVKRKFLIVAGLFISGLNPLWATSSQKITSNIKIKGNSSKSLSQNQKQQRVLYELNAPEDLFLPSKLISMFASGKPIISNAKANTDLVNLVNRAGIRVDPYDHNGFINAINNPK